MTHTLQRVETAAQVAAIAAANPHTAHTRYRCESCGALTESPVAHEQNRHEGAQTCWPVQSA